MRTVLVLTLVSLAAALHGPRPPPPPPEHHPGHYHWHAPEPHHHEFSCEGKPEGVYPSPKHHCVGHFWKCAHGVAFKYECPKDLFYSAKTDRCDYKENVFECQHHHHHREPYHDLHHHHPHHPQDYHHKPPHVEHHFEPHFEYKPLHHHYPEHYVEPHHEHPKPLHYHHPEPLPYHRPEPLPYHRPEPVHHHRPEPPRHHHFDCKGKEDGPYPLGRCHHEFAQCSGEVVTYQKCPTDLVFSALKPRCIEKEECLKEHLHKPHHHDHYPEPHHYYHPEPPHEHRPLPDYHHEFHHLPHPHPHHHRFDCSDKPDGYYPIGHCHPKFVMCSNGFRHEQNCPSGLVFRLSLGLCDYKENCIKHVHHKQEIKPIPERPPLCAHHHPGPVPLHDCSPEFLVCFKDRHYLNACPADLIFNHKIKQCDFKPNVLECAKLPFYPKPLPKPLPDVGSAI